jgi:hypothetical protein
VSLAGISYARHPTFLFQHKLAEDLNVVRFPHSYFMGVSITINVEHMPETERRGNRRIFCTEVGID